MIVLVVFGLIQSYTGRILGKCWTLLRKRYPQYTTEENVPDPYNVIGYRAAGKWGLIASRVSNFVALFGTGELEEFIFYEE